VFVSYNKCINIAQYYYNLNELFLYLNIFESAIFWSDAGFHLVCDSHSALWVFSSLSVYIGCTLVIVVLAGTE